MIVNCSIWFKYSFRLNSHFSIIFRVFFSILCWTNNIIVQSAAIELNVLGPKCVLMGVHCLSTCVSKILAWRWPIICIFLCVGTICIERARSICNGYYRKDVLLPIYRHGPYTILYIIKRWVAITSTTIIQTDRDDNILYNVNANTTHTYRWKRWLVYIYNVHITIFVVRHWIFVFTQSTIVHISVLVYDK